MAFDIGNVAVGCSDGYMGTAQQYRRWAHASDAKRFGRRTKTSITATSTMTRARMVSGTDIKD
jgi:hypothetical protein